MHTTPVFNSLSVILGVPAYRDVVKGMLVNLKAVNSVNITSQSNQTAPETVENN